MRRLGALVAVGLVLAATGCKPREDPVVLRRNIARSANESHTFTVRVASREAAYVVDGKLEDDLRYSMLLRSATGKPLVDYVVTDDTLAVRLRDPAFGRKLANVLGDPVVDRALKSGEWVQDPAGAPPVVQPTTAAGQTSGNPFQDGRHVLLLAEQALGQASFITKFSLEDITYKSRFDPWRYPGSGETRYDVRAPALPHSEAQTISRAGGDVGPQHFRKLSMYARGGRIDEICEAIDIFGHEDYVAVKERGERWNPFLTALFDRVLKGDTTTPIRPRQTVVDLEYPDEAPVSGPGKALAGKLTVFVSAFQQAITAGVLRPANPVELSECRRTSDERTTD